MNLALRIKQLVIAIVLLGALALPAEAAITRNLSLGDRGDDVRELQVLLNRDARTKLTASGPGSPGNETDYFGPLTRDAVKRFQTSHASSVLAPLDLSAPTGYVGQNTRAQLQTLFTIVSQSGSATFSDVNNEPSSQIAPQTDVAPTQITSSEALRNLAIEHFDDYARIVREQLSNQGISESQIEDVLNDVQDAIDTADYSVFFEAQNSPTAGSVLDSIRDAGGDPDDSVEDLLEQILETDEPISSLFLSWLLPQRAHAQTGLIPYGSLINVPYPCICTGGVVWQMYITGYIYGVPTEFSLDYILGTQLYLFYTLPFAQKQLGFFVPSSGSCFQGIPPFCSSIPAVGTVTPIVGSSLII